MKYKQYYKRCCGNGDIITKTNSGDIFAISRGLYYNDIKIINMNLCKYYDTIYCDNYDHLTAYNDLIIYSYRTKIFIYNIYTKTHETIFNKCHISHIVASNDIIITADFEYSIKIWDIKKCEFIDYLWKSTRSIKTLEIYKRSIIFTDGFSIFIVDIYNKSLLYSIELSNFNINYIPLAIKIYQDKLIIPNKSGRIMIQDIYNHKNYEIEHSRIIDGLYIFDGFIVTFCKNVIDFFDLETGILLYTTKVMNEKIYNLMVC